MTKSATITLGGAEYALRPFNLDELQEVGVLLGDGKNVNGGTSIGLVKIALRRATPKIADPGSVEATMSELGAATKTILDLAGLASDPTAAAPAGS